MVEDTRTLSAAEM